MTERCRGVGGSKWCSHQWWHCGICSQPELQSSDPIRIEQVGCFFFSALKEFSHLSKRKTEKKKPKPPQPTNSHTPRIQTSYPCADICASVTWGNYLRRFCFNSFNFEIRFAMHESKRALETGD